MSSSDRLPGVTPDENFHNFSMTFPNYIRSTFINLNILSLPSWLMLLFTLVKSCCNMYKEGDKKALRRGCDVSKMFKNSLKKPPNIYNTQRWENKL